MTSYLGAVDQGTTSTRFIIFDKDGGMVTVSRMEHDQICEKPGWVAHDPVQIRDNTITVIARALKKAGLTGRDLAAIGITNQRETVAAWTGTRDNRCIMPLSGSAPEVTRSAGTWMPCTAKTASGRKPVCPRPPIFPVPRSNG